MQNQRSYSLLTVKSVDEEAREITGIATTPSADAYGDIVEPGARSFLCLSRCYGSTTITTRSGR